MGALGGLVGIGGANALGAAGIGSSRGLMGFNFALGAISTISSLMNQPAPPFAYAGRGPWRPQNWSYGPQLWYMTVDGTNYFFDATLRSEHNHELEYTKHPVQDGPAITDHSYIQPTRVILEIGMSDAMDSFVSDQYGGATSKSINAFQTFVKIQSTRKPFTLTTRLLTYQHMLLVLIQAIDDARTLRALRARLVFAQIIPAKVSTTITSVPGNTPGDITRSVGLGPPDNNFWQLSPIPPPDSIGIHVAPPGAGPPGSGGFSSNPTPSP